MLGLEEAGESCGSAVQTPCNPEYLPGLVSWRHPVHRDRDFLPEDDHGPGCREELQHRCPVHPGEVLDADPGEDVDSLILKERCKIHAGP